MKFTVATLLLANLAVLASAFTTPVGDTPSGNPIHKPNLGDIVPKGQPYTITWTPTSSGTVTLVLLRGPSTNVVPLAPIVEKIANSGSYEWTPASSLEADTSRYGIQIIQDDNGAYQYSTQFGIGESAGSSSGGSSSATVSPTDAISKAAVTGYSSSTGTATDAGSSITTTVSTTHTVTSCSTVCSHNATTTVSSTSSSSTSVSTVTSSTAYTNTTGSSTTASPTTLRTSAPSSSSVSSSLRPSSSSAPANASSTSLPPPNSAAGQLAVSLGSATVIGLAGFIMAICWI